MSKKSQTPAELAPVETTAPAADKERVAKVIARAGLGSRRDVEAWIVAGRVSVNGAIITSPALNVGTSDTIIVDGAPLPTRERTRLWLYNKPRGLVTTEWDPEGRPTVFSAMPEHLPRVISVGRLDINTEGLLMLTNDGALASLLEHPKTGWTRRYRVRAFGVLSQDQIDQMAAGMVVDDIHYEPIECIIDRVQGDNIWLVMTLTEGKNREIKKVLDSFGLKVTRLIRVSYGPFQLREMPEGEIEEVPMRILKDQLGPNLTKQGNLDFESPLRQVKLVTPEAGSPHAPRPNRGGTSKFAGGARKLERSPKTDEKKKWERPAFERVLRERPEGEDRYERVRRTPATPANEDRAPRGEYKPREDRPARPYTPRGTNDGARAPYKATSKAAHYAGAQAGEVEFQRAPRSEGDSGEYRARPARGEGGKPRNSFAQKSTSPREGGRDTKPAHPTAKRSSYYIRMDEPRGENRDAQRTEYKPREDRAPRGEYKPRTGGAARPSGDRPNYSKPSSGGRPFSGGGNRGGKRG